MKRDSATASVVSPPPRLGRPRTFDRAQALTRAMLTFWTNGFETTSLSVLAKKMEMNPPSIYAAFGDKEALFLEALALYVGDLDDLRTFVERAPSARAAAELVLKASADRFTGANTPRGCMLASAAAAGSPDAARVQTAAAKHRSRIEAILKERFAADIKTGAKTRGPSAEDLAALTLTLIQGLSVLARDGAQRKRLYRVIDAALMAWPTSV